MRGGLTAVSLIYVDPALTDAAAFVAVECVMIQMNAAPC